MVDELDPDTLERLLAADAAVQVVDVRPPAAFNSGYIPDSENVPFEQLLEGIDTVEWGERVVFVCPYGQRSRQAGELLRAYAGIDDSVEIYNLSGGLQAWDGPLIVTQSDEG